MLKLSNPRAISPTPMLAIDQNVAVEAGDEMLIWCRGGRSTVKRQSYPPLPEIEERDGVYVLDDSSASPTDWTYEFVAHRLG